MPWIRLSHDNSTDSVVLAMQHGAVDFVPKPVDMNRLLGAIRRTLAARDAATVHEDRHVVERLVILCDGCITVEDVKMYARGLCWMVHCEI